MVNQQRTTPSTLLFYLSFAQSSVHRNCFARINLFVGEKDDAACALPCQGDPDQMCGGQVAMHVLSATSRRFIPCEAMMPSFPQKLAAQ